MSTHARVYETREQTGERQIETGRKRQTEREREAIWRERGGKTLICLIGVTASILETNPCVCSPTKFSSH